MTDQGRTTIAVDAVLTDLADDGDIDVTSWTDLEGLPADIDVLVAQAQEIFEHARTWVCQRRGFEPSPVCLLSPLADLMDVLAQGPPGPGRARNHAGLGVRKLPGGSLEELLVMPLTGDYRRIRGRTRSPPASSATPWAPTPTTPCCCRWRRLQVRLASLRGVILIDPPNASGHGRLWSHVASDASYDELHAFARLAGIPERGFDRDHYDVPAEWYDEVVALGARPVSSRELVSRLRAAGLRRRKGRRTASRGED